MAKVAVIRVPRLSPVTRAKVKHHARRAFGAASRVAQAEKHTVTALAAAAALGYASRPGKDGAPSMASKLPKVDALGVAGTYGALAWLAAKQTKNPTLAHVATGLLSIAAYKFGAGEKTAGDDEEASGDLDDVHEAA
jgi:hypothetical protein